MSNNINFPPQQLSMSRKGKKWRQQHLDWADSKSYFNYSPVRNSLKKKRINYDLVNGILHMSDLEQTLNPYSVQGSFTVDKIQHYPIINSKLNVLRGEEFKRVFDGKVIVTNPNAISEIEEAKTAEIMEELHAIIENQELSEEEYMAEVERIDEYYNYDWQDSKEIRANALLNHYSKELNFPLIFNNGFMDALIVGEEIYQVDIRGGEPILEKINPVKITAFRSGHSNKFEDADVIILEDYWSPGKIIDTYYDVLSDKDIKYIEDLPNKTTGAATDSMDNLDERHGFINASMMGEEFEGIDFDPLNLFAENTTSSLAPFDTVGNIRHIHMFWKSRRKIKKVKSYDPETGEELYNFYPEKYILDVDAGEEEQIFFINEAWEGIKIGKEIYVNMRPRVVQYNRLSNPSRCHFGIIGSIYNLNETKPYSLVDMMKPYNYLYNAIHDRLNKSIAANWGKILELDLATVPKGWEIDKWMYYAKVNSIAVKDSFKEGNVGAATGKMAGQFAQNSRGVIDAETGNHIQQQINLLEFIKLEMSDVAGISRQREGQISNRETVGGVERATLQSAHITEWYYMIHDDVKKRVLEAFLETAKIALRGRTKKFQYVLSDNSIKIIEIDGDEFAEADYGLVVDNSDDTQILNQKLDALAQAALQNQLLSFGTVVKMYGSSSIAEKQRMIERDEAKMQENQAQQAQAQQEAEQQIMQAEMEMKGQEMELKQLEIEQKEQANIRDNETKMMIASINAQANLLTSFDDGVEEVDPAKKEELEEKIRQFDEKLRFDREKLDKEIKVKEKAIKEGAKSKVK